jgi:hypothetical protein
MAGANESRGTERAEAGWENSSEMYFMREFDARLSRPERCVVIASSGTFVSAPLVAGGFMVPSVELPVSNRKYRSAIQLFVCNYPFKSLRSRAISALSAVADDSDDSIKQFGNLLLDSHPMVKWTVLDALDKRHERIADVIPEVIKLLEDESDVYIAISNHHS